MKYLTIVLLFVVNILVGQDIQTENFQTNLFIKEGDSLLNKAREYLDAGKASKALESSQKALDIFRQHTDSLSYEFANAYSYLGLSNMVMGQADLAIEQLKITENIWSKLFEPNHKYIGDVNHYLGSCYFKKGDYSEALHRFKKAYNIRKDTFGKNNNLTAGSAQNVALAFSQKGALDSADYYLSEAVRIREALYPEGNLNLANTYLSVGAFLIIKGNYENAEFQLTNAKKIFEKIAPNHPNLGMVYSNLGIVAFKLNDYRKAIEYYEYNLKHANVETDKKYTINQISSLINIAICYKNLDEIDIAEHYLNDAHKILLDNNRSKNPEYLNVIAELGHLKRRKNDFVGAKKYYQTAYSFLLSLNDTISLDFYELVLNMGDIYRITKSDSASYFYSKYWEKTQENSDYSNTNLGKIKILRFLYEQGFTDSCLNLIKSEKIKYQNLQDNETWKPYFNYLNYLHVKITKNLNEARIVFSNYYDLFINNFSNRQKEISIINKKVIAEDEEFYRTICLELLSNYNIFTSDSLKLDAAWYLIESTKSAQTYINRGLQRLTGINKFLDSLIYTSFTLKSNISDYTKAHKRLILSHSSHSSDKEITEMVTKIESTQAKLDTMLGLINQNYPKEYKTVFNTSLSTIKDLKNTMTPDECVINYHLSDTILYSILVTLDTIIFTVTTCSKSEIETISYTINHPDFTIDEKSRNKILSHGYKIFIEPFETFLKPKIRIIPSSLMNYLPFEAFTKLDEKSGPTKYSYLQQKYFFTYAFSATSIKDIEPHKGNKNIVFSPFAYSNSLKYKSDAQLRMDSLVLINTLEEAKVVNSYLKGIHLNNNLGTLQKFRDLAASADVIHLATHAFSNENDINDAYVLFSNSTPENKLWVNELESIPFIAKLVVLSACETNIGKIEKGEGVVSLAHAFSLAGVQSVISTLWKINDVATSDLIPLFYKYFTAGKSNGESLTLAKRAYLSKAQGRYRHPYYWAGFVLHGNPNLYYNR
ncbi:MAG: CHAT domain-containing protein [Saprospiraceae bacterium]|nr:CHAT domain-containing protein [Saprospiraceae bacterium]